MFFGNQGRTFGPNTFGPKVVVVNLAEGVREVSTSRKTSRGRSLIFETGAMGGSLP